jgi:retron-type reverse transcriptase
VTIMDESVNQIFSFHSHIASTYLEVHEWLSQVLDLSDTSSNYRKKSIRNKVDKLLSVPSLFSAAAQYYVLFPAHFFKVAYTLEKIVGVEKLCGWLEYNPRICLIDVGCGAGAASAAFINSLLDLQDEAVLSHPLDVYCIGIDINCNAIALYDRFLERLKRKVKESGINLEYNLIPYGDLRAIGRLKDFLNSQREKWQQPYIHQVLVMQVNVVSPFSRRYENTEADYGELANLGVDLSLLGEYHQAFGREEASAYKQILEDVSIDYMHVITIGTEDWEYRVGEMAEAIELEFAGGRHVVEKLGVGAQKVHYQLPDGCYWTEWEDSHEYFSDFHVDVSTISNTALEDEDWNAVKSIDNLKVAWARARHHLLGQTLVDEVEIRLFETNLDENIARLQKQLVAYAEDVICFDDRVFFKLPKGASSTRPMGLSRIEEEVLSTAIIQQLGQRIVGLASRSYAYRFSRYYGEHYTEYLYEPWFDAYTRYINYARNEAQRHENCAVIRTDIKSFFARIVRDQLLQVSAEQLSKSARIEWLLRLLFSRDIDEHEVGHGIVQGNIASGFFANLYLIDLDARFSSNNEWSVGFHRYVDDMIAIVPNPEHVSEVQEAIEAELDDLDLEINERKTKVYYDLSQFLDDTAEDDLLARLHERFGQVVNALWITNSDWRGTLRRSYFETNEEWWYRIKLYQRCLRSINIFITPSILSRMVYKYLFNQRRCEDDLKRESELLLPSLPSNDEPKKLDEWAACFEEQNQVWVAERRDLQNELSDLFCRSWKELSQAIQLEDSAAERKWTRRLRFAVNRLSQLGFLGIADEVVHVLCSMPWLIRNPASVVESLARQGFSEHIYVLLTQYSNESDPMQEYMKAIVLRAIRFMPDIELELWDELVECTISTSTATCLLASETWLHLGPRCQHLVTDRHLHLLRSALTQGVQPISRLKKNYLLILGMHDVDSVRDMGAEDHFLISAAQDIILESGTEALFDYEEPEVLRRTFYSGRRVDDLDVYDHSPF